MPAEADVVMLNLQCCISNGGAPGDFLVHRSRRDEDADWIHWRFRKVNAAMGADVVEEDGRLVADLRSG